MMKPMRLAQCSRRSGAAGPSFLSMRPRVKKRRDLYTAAGGEANRIAHIDGLRAIAVLAVVAFHANVPFVTGGFVGVDVFFVISGYLIINHIVRELDADRFTFAKFYARRSLRLMPPLFVTIAVTTIASAFIMVSPHEWQWFALSAVTASVFASN
ncbi:MAG TPA: acyltransferase, partial [Rhodospirillales bacterium]|nr:acyltransferase [Rhodospirillales bacterium]